MLVFIFHSLFAWSSFAWNHRHGMTGMAVLFSAVLTVSLTGCGDPQPRVVEPTGEYSFEDMNAMAAEDAAESEEADQ